MTTAPNDPITALPGRPPVVDVATWQTARDELLVREKAHTREGDALAAARRQLPMVELDGTVEGYFFWKMPFTLSAASFAMALTYLYKHLVPVEFVLRLKL